MLTSIKLYIYSVQLGRQSTDMKNVSISEFRANLLQYLKLSQRGQRINVTSKGRVMATLIPPTSQQEAARETLKRLAKTAVITDVTSPIGENWDAMK